MSRSGRQGRLVDAELLRLSDEELAEQLIRQVGIRRARRLGALLKPPAARRPNQSKSNEQRLAFLRQQFESVAADVALDDPEDLRLLVEFLATAEKHIRAAGREQGLRHGWPEVGSALGTTRQAARQRFGA